jgi:hypothetical protein
MQVCEYLRLKYSKCMYKFTVPTAKYATLDYYILMNVLHASVFDNFLSFKIFTRETSRCRYLFLLTDHVSSHIV